MSEEMEKEVELMGSLRYGIRIEAFEEGREKEARDIVLNLHQMGIPIEKIAQAVRYPEEKIAEWLCAAANTTQ